MTLFTALILLVILVNGWTDAPNAIAGCISTRSMTPRAALAMAAVCNFVGALGMALVNTRVAQTLGGIVEFGGPPEEALASLSAGLCAVVLWALVAWRFGIPTSESHALISGLTGAAFAERMSTDAINAHEWGLVLLGLFATTLPAALLGWLFSSVLRKFFARRERRRVMRYFLRTQRASAATSALLHGAQDSQKFMGVYLLGLSLIKPSLKETDSLPLSIILICASVMTLGTMLGGAKIIKKVGMDMIDLDAAGGSASDAASSTILTVCSFFGIPASTTHSKACAMMGTGLGKRGGVDFRIASQILAAWALTFPICGVIGFLLARLFSHFPLLH